jgi:D-serine deaminase-like pyridoxal phosphate-dependent protein
MRLEELDTPAAVVDLNVVERNLLRLAEYCRLQHFTLRPHTKTHKIPEIARWQVEAGAGGITVAKVGEAEVMAAAGLDDILIAYPVIGCAKLERLVKLARKKTMTVAIDSTEALEGIAAAASRAGVNVTLLVECDLGMRRCGVQTPEEALRLIHRSESLSGVKFGGILFYPGQVRVPPDLQPFALSAVSEKLQTHLEAFSRAGVDCRIVSGGSTPTAYSSHLLIGMNEIRPGTYVFNDRNTLELGACALEDCAFRVLVTVVSTAVPGRAVIDGGSKTFSSDRLLGGAGEDFGLVVEDPGIRLEAMTEEHGHLEVSRAAQPLQIGSRLSIIPNHVCTCVNLHDRIFYHRGGEIQGCWPVAGRGRIC